MTFTHDKYAALANELFVQLETLDMGRYDVQAATTVSKCRELCHEMIKLCKKESKPIVTSEPSTGFPTKDFKNNFKVFLIDDDEDLHRIAKFAFSRVRIETIVEKNPLVALDKISEVKPNIIILDIMMPEMTGFEVLTRLNERSDRKSFHVIVVSSRSYDKDRVAVLEAGADDYMAKPLQISELVLRIQHLAA